MPDKFNARNTIARALIVDDDRDGAESLAMLLRMQGYAAKPLCDARHLIEESVSYNPDIIFLDIFIPGLSGIEAARRLRREAALDHIWLVALTGSQEAMEVHEAFRAGFDAYYLKPIDPPALSALLTLSAQDRSAIGLVLGPRLSRVYFGPRGRTD